MAELIVLTGKLKGKRILLSEGEVFLGRNETCQIRIASSLISHQHCALHIGPEGIRVRDLGSENGTYVNDLAVTESVILRPGDILRVGAILFQVPDPLTNATKSENRPNPGKISISDASIADWLASVAETKPPSNADTTIITGRASTKVEADPSSVSPPPEPPPSRGYRSLKEEAAEIIRMHWKAVKSKTKQ